MRDRGEKGRAIAVAILNFTIASDRSVTSTFTRTCYPLLLRKVFINIWDASECIQMQMWSWCSSERYNAYVLQGNYALTKIQATDPSARRMSA